jgi:hypothetical protein
VWSKLGARSPFITGWTPGGTPVGGGLSFTIPEEMLYYALLYTPSWNVLLQEKVISDDLLTLIQTMGDPKAYEVSTELTYGQKWVSPSHTSTPVIALGDGKLETSRRWETSGRWG